MNKYQIYFMARRIGSIGIWTEYERVVEASGMDEAILKLYDTFEHISIGAIDMVP